MPPCTKHQVRSSDISRLPLRWGYTYVVFLPVTGRKVSAEEINTSRGIWKDFMGKIVRHMHAQDGGEMNTTERFDHALLQLAKDKPDVFGEHNIVAEISQTFRHGYEAIAGCICWVFYALMANPKVSPSRALHVFVVIMKVTLHIFFPISIAASHYFGERNHGA